MTHQDIIKLILDKGDIQTGEKERDEGKANLKRYVSNIIVQKTYNTDNGLPFPQDIITKALDNINFKYNEKDNEKKQAMRGIKELISHKILPIERRLMQLKLTLKKIENENNPILENAEKLQEFNKNLINYIKEIESEIIENDTSSVDNFNLKINIKTQYYRDILNKYDKILNIEVLSQDEISQKVKDKIKEKGENNNTISTETQKIDEIEKHFENMRISDVTVEKYLEENYGDMEENSKSKKNKKKLTCTKCKDSSFNDRDELRQHCKTNWHKYNALQSAKEGTSLSAEEYDEYVLMHPEELK